jgi:hypothetical protein
MHLLLGKVVNRQEDFVAPEVIAEDSEGSLDPGLEEVKEMGEALDRVSAAQEGSAAGGLTPL